MYLLKVLIFYYYLFYKRVIPWEETKRLTIFAISISTHFLLFPIVLSKVLPLWDIDLIALGYSEYLWWGLLGVSLLLYYFLFFRGEKYTNIIESQPKLFNNHYISICFTVLFFCGSCFLFIKSATW